MKRSTGLRELAGRSSDARTSALLEEAARIADRLDALNEALTRDGLLDLIERESESTDERRVVEVRVTGALSEARQQAVALRTLLAQVGVPALDAAQPKERSSLDAIRDDLAARRASRSAEAEPVQPSAVR